MVQIKMGPEYELVCAPQRKDESSNNRRCLLETVNDPQNRLMKNQDAHFFLRKRYLFSFLVSVGMMVSVILRLNLSIAIVEMTSDKNITVKNETYIEKAEFDWDSKTKGLLLGISSVGQFSGPVGGLLAMKYGGVTIFCLGIGVTAVLNILTPFIVRFNVYVYLVVRMLEGVFDCFPMSCVLHLYTRWAPPNERSRMILSSIIGVLLGGAINYPISGFLAFRYGWECIFFITGGISLIWCIIWFVLTSNEPTTDVLMTRKERNYFKSLVPPYIKKKKIIYPWKTMFTSKPFWIYLNEFFSFFWSQSFLIACLPIYIKDSFNVDIQSIGIISGIPILGGVIGLAFTSYLFDYLRSGGIYSQPSLHRVFITIGQISSVICFIYIGLWANLIESIVVLAIARILMSFAETSYQVLAVDLFYEYAGLVRGFGVATSGLSQVLNPIVMGFIVADHSRASWNYYFLFLSVFNIWSVVIFYLYGSGEMQEWAAPKIANEDNEKKFNDNQSELQC